MRAAALAAAVTAIACTKARDPEPAPAEPAVEVAEPAPAPPAVPPPILDAALAPPPPPPADLLARRCRVHGDPLAATCSGGGGSLAVDGAGRLYVVDDATVRRFVPRVDATGCELAIDDAFADRGALPLPAIEPPGQRLGDGPVYLQSGGPEWRVAAGAGDAVYLHEFLRGIHRIDRGAVVPVCPALQGARRIALAGGKAYVDRGDGERIRLGGKCPTTPLRLDPPPRFGLYAAAGALLGDPGDGLVRYGERGRDAVTLGGGDAFAPGGLCSVAGVIGCGPDGGDVCVLDGNCKKLVRYGLDGALRGQLDSDDLFAVMPYGVSAIAPTGDGGAWLLALHKDGKTCEGAVYHVPGAAL